MRKVFVFAAVGLAFLASQVQAQSTREFADVYTECGLGAMLFNAEGQGSENGKLLAIVSNVTWDLGTTAHISNMSSPDSCAAASMSTAMLIIDQYPEIETDLSRGTGEHLVAMMDTFQCGQPSETVVPALQSDLADMLGSGEYVNMDRLDKAAVIYDSLATHCSV